PLLHVGGLINTTSILCGYNEAEGTFGDLKQNQGYNRLRRRGESGVKLEIYMIAIGQNIRKYHRRKIENRKKVEKLLLSLN
ncbi:transposase, partial [Thomasclavelia cocleata]|uniref:transposase n=1 Tax=Thomasclavelia cocleata TaxID=69824 RepID=UPI002557F3AC